MKSTVHVSAKPVTSISIILLLFIVLMDFLRLFFKAKFSSLTGLNHWFETFFKLTGEHNVPTLYSTVILLLAGGLLYLIHTTTSIQQDKIYWFFLSMIFFFLAFDEALKIHEALSQLIRGSTTVEGSIRYGTWAIPYLIVTAIIGLLYLRFVLRLPTFTRNLIILSGVIFVGSAGGVELVEGYLFLNYGEESIMYKITHSTQEIGEMAGIVLFNHTLLNYLASGNVVIEITA
jgi:hypothetical protein